MVVNTITSLLNPIDTITKYLNPFNEQFIFTKLFNNVSSIFDVFNVNGDNFIFTNMFKNISDMLSYINPFSDNFFLKGLLNILNPFSDDFFLKKLFNWINPFSDDFFLKDLFSWINPFSDNFIGKKIVELIGDLLKFLFVPSEDSINNLVNSVKSHFGFIDTINNTSSMIKDMFNDSSKLPKVTLTLKDNEWYNGEITVIDLSWYAPYKEYGDMIISAFIYVFFFWRIFVNLPSIISGAGGAFNDTTIATSDIQAYTKFGFGRRSSLTRHQR